jgi:hypothetical protein
MGKHARRTHFDAMDDVEDSATKPGMRNLFLYSIAIM